MTPTQPPVHPLRQLARRIPPVRWALRAVKRTFGVGRRAINSVRWRAEAARCDAQFKLANAQALNALQRTPEARWAVVLHLYYTDTWDFFLERLRRLNGQPFDLFVTLPIPSKDFQATIERDMPGAKVILVPNRGRDVLPFLYVLPLIEQLGYEWFLKLHSKKSKHRTDGADWLTELADNLVPTSPQARTELLAALERKDTGIVGPAGHFVSLVVNLEANEGHIERILRQTGSYRREVLRRPGKFGFFAGTMFWARVDAVAPITRQRYSAGQFEPEAGQIDGTFAHALERIFCLVPEIAGRKLYQSGDTGTVAVDPSSGHVPDWSNVYIGPNGEAKTKSAAKRP